MTNFEWMRQRLLQRAGVIEAPSAECVREDLFRSEWSARFERYMPHNRLAMGALRYGKLHTPDKPQFDRLESIISRVKRYKSDGNLEWLVDIANLALLEFEEGRHPRKHFKSVDDGEHVKTVEELL